MQTFDINSETSINSETAETTCPNCQGSLRAYQSNNDRIDMYCVQHDCCFSTNYNSEFFYPYNYFKENGKNIGSFHFINIYLSIIQSTRFT